jgi:hypothetical protein
VAGYFVTGKEIFVFRKMRACFLKGEEILGGRERIGLYMSPT